MKVKPIQSYNKHDSIEKSKTILSARRRVGAWVGKEVVE